MPLWFPDKAALVKTQCRLGHLIMLLWCPDKSVLVKTQCRFGYLIMLLWGRHNAAWVT
jgi:hypothetical protein